MIYGFLSTILFILILPFWLVIGLFKRKLTVGFKQKCGYFNSPILENSIVFYGVSVGEINALENLIKRTKQTFDNPSNIMIVNRGLEDSKPIMTIEGSGTIEFTVNAVTTQRNFLLTTRSLSGGEGATIQVLHNSAWETVGSISSAEIANSSGCTFKGTFPKDNNDSADISFKLLPVGETNFDGYAMVVYD